MAEIKYIIKAYIYIQIGINYNIYIVWMTEKYLCMDECIW